MTLWQLFILSLIPYLLNYAMNKSSHKNFWRIVKCLFSLSLTCFWAYYLGYQIIVNKTYWLIIIWLLYPFAFKNSIKQLIGIIKSMKQRQ